MSKVTLGPDFATFDLLGMHLKIISHLDHSSSFLANKASFKPGFKSSMCYDHNKCRFQYYNGLLSKPLSNYSLQKKPERKQTKKQNIHSFLYFVLKAVFDMIVTHGRFKTW